MLLRADSQLAGEQPNALIEDDLFAKESIPNEKRPILPCFWLIFLLFVRLYLDVLRKTTRIHIDS
jgi:hypothetical protein